MKKILVPLLSLLLLVLGASTATARPGALDPNFGRDGRVIRSADFGTLPWSLVRTKMTSLPDGRFVMLAGDSLYGFRGNGAIGGAFGPGEGPVPTPSGGEFTAAGIAADTAGRVLVAGTLKLAGSNPWEAENEAAMVVRYASSGELDSSFGKGGVLVTTFGLPPRREPGEAPGPTQVQLAGVAADSRDRVVLTGTRTRMIGPCRSSTGLIYRAAFAVRLTASGTPDADFGDRGLVPFYDIASVEAPVLDEDDGLYVTTPYAGRGPCTEPQYDRLIGRLDAEGALDTRFGQRGWVSLPFRPSRSAVSSAPGPDGSLLLFENQWVKRKSLDNGRSRPAHTVVRVSRLSPTGKLDPRFGSDGRATLGAPSGSLEVAQGAVDSGGRVIVAGTHSKPRHPKQRTFFVGRLTARGDRDRSFGRAGLTVTGWGKSAAAVGSSLLLGPTRAILGGTAESSHFGAGSGLALAGYRW
ncbi:MAG: hypothetical protein QOF06_1167 [Solirubrobacterales bacterium]|jgi:uncharacterized delta-60 repeat protein|nr:hypothetical protein [Solirubrobacterales bacterium]